MPRAALEGIAELLGTTCSSDFNDEIRWSERRRTFAEQIARGLAPLVSPASLAARSR